MTKMDPLVKVGDLLVGCIKGRRVVARVQYADNPYYVVCRDIVTWSRYKVMGDSVYAIVDPVRDLIPECWALVNQRW